MVNYMKSLQDLELKLNSLRQKYKKADKGDRQTIINQAKLIKWAIEKLDKPFETAKRLFK